jgi:peptidoglycan/xylan/chitin deacetylase (PgdA/CDA1 family)
VSVVSQGPAAEGLVALTFDDGPGPQTPDILDLFRQHGGHGTFFVLGESVEGREEILGRTIAEGHEIGNHTFSHPHAMDATDDELAHDIARCQRLLGHAPVLFRPPYGEDALRCSRIAEARMLPTTVLWSVDPSDWLERDLLATAHVHRGRSHADGGGAAHRAARDGRPRVPVGDRQRAACGRPDWAWLSGIRVRPSRYAQYPSRHYIWWVDPVGGHNIWGSRELSIL